MKDSLRFITPEWKWCDTCNVAAMICPICGNNACNAGYGQVNGKTCNTCPAVYDAQEAAYKEGKAPGPDDIAHFGGEWNKYII